MAAFAPVAPIQILEAMKKEDILGTYHLLLAHHVLEHPKRFEELFHDINGCTIIMDNSIVELGDAENEAKVLEAYEIVQRANSRNWVYPVITDVMGNGIETREKATASYEWWMESEAGADLMVVLQGDDFEDFCVTADYFLLNPKFRAIEYVGIPRILANTIGTRQQAVAYVEAIRPDISVHLLGFSDHVTDDLICANHPSVEGIDSAVPIRYGSCVPEGASKIYWPTASIPPRDPNWFEEGVYDASIAENLFNIRQWVA